MNNIEKHTDDLLREFITPERIEKAPDGFMSVYKISTISFL